MAKRTHKQLKKERYQRIYFHYWKLQNNPEYIKFWEKQTTFLEDFQKNPEQTLAKVDKNFFTDSEEIIKFGLGGRLPDPYKKIDWKALIDSDKVDLDILRGLTFSPLFHSVHVQRFHREVEPDQQPETRNPILRLLIDLSKDKEETLNQVSKYIDKWREIRKIELSKNRDQVGKFHIYAEIWDLRKGFPKLTFRDIGRKLKRPIKTVHSQFKRAYEYLYNKPYESTEHRAVIRSFVRKTSCKNCPERFSCKIPCPEIEILLKEIEAKQAHKLDQTYFDKSGKRKSTYEYTLDREAFRRWQEKSD